MPNFFGAHNHINANRVSAPQDRLHPVQRRRHRGCLGQSGRRDFRFCFLSHGECCRKIGLNIGPRRRLGAFRRQGEYVDTQLLVLQKIFRDLQLLSVSIRRGNRRIRPGESMRVNEAINVPHVLRSRERHMAIGALRRFRGIVKRPRALARDPAGLPVIVFVEAAEPTIVVYRHIEVNLVAS